MKAPKAKRTRGRPVTHGLSRTKAYRSWHWITYCSKEPYFSEAYYGYPISLCKEWRGKKGMTQFYQDMGERPEYAQLKVTDVEQCPITIHCFIKVKSIFEKLSSRE